MSDRPFVVVVCFTGTTKPSLQFFATREAADKRAEVERAFAAKPCSGIVSVEVADMRVAP